MVDAITNWMASINESRWHLIEKEGGSPVALCTHRVRGPVRRIISLKPPEFNDGRSICHNCQNQAIEIRRKLEETTKRKYLLDQALRIAESDLIIWPETDPMDQPEQEEAPGSPYLPGTERELIAAA